MAQTSSLIDLLLTQATAGYFPSQFIADSVFPKIAVEQTTGKLGKYGTSHLRIEATLKAGRGAYRRVEAITRSTTSYSIDGHGLEGMVTPDDYRNVLVPFDAEKDEAKGLATMVLLEKEQVLANGITDNSVITQGATLAGVGQFSDYVNSDPIGQFNTGVNTVLNACGQKPNVAVMDEYTKRILRFHPQMLDALGFKFQRPGGLTDQELASALGMDKILVSQARFESAKEGQTSSLSAVFGKHILLGVLPDAAEPYQVSLGYMVTYKDMARKVFKYSFNNPPGATGIIFEDSYQFLISNASAGYLLRNAVA